MKDVTINSLGFDKPTSQTRVVVAMSGGVDSSVTAAVLVEEGYDVIGVTLQLYDYGQALAKKGACCAGKDIYDAQQVAERLKIPHYVLNYESLFSDQVMNEFADSYIRGETPIPCVRCNQTVKFRDLLKVANDLGADALATGHYVRRVMGPRGPELHRGQDEGRDQSYFLFATTREQLAYLRFPLGALSKDATRALAERHQLEVAQKPDSQDICFVPNGDYARVVNRLRPGAMQPGFIVNEAGEVLGAHDGIINFTVGQRRGLNLGHRAGDEKDPLYVLSIDPKTNQVKVGPRSSLATERVWLREMNWLATEAASTPRPVQIKLRSSQKPIAGTMTQEKDFTIVSLDDPVFGVAPGQAGVLYDGNQVLGGGWITREPSR